MAYDLSRSRTVLYGGDKESQTWAWTGEIWVLEWAGTPPAYRYSPALAYAEARESVFMFGGYAQFGTTDDLIYEWDGSNWSFVVSEVRPSPRFWHSLSFDRQREVLVLFGGLYQEDNGDTIRLGETWEFDGEFWMRRDDLAHTPGPRFVHSMVYDSARGVSVLFGGFDAQADIVGDTWEYDGTEWVLRSETGPSPRVGHAMVYDSDRAVTVLFGGRTPEFEQQDLWEWDGQDWTLVPTDNPPPRRVHHAMAYDSARKAIVMFGGENVLGENLGDTWEYVCAPSCYPDLDDNLNLDLFDFLAFLNLFNADDPAADCDGSGALDLFDFLCFLNAFNEGC